jgi:hypothetical protein
MEKQWVLLSIHYLNLLYRHFISFTHTSRNKPYSTTSIIKFLTLEIVLIGCPETSIRNYHYSLHNSPKECSSRDNFVLIQVLISVLHWHLLACSHHFTPDSYEYIREASILHTLCMQDRVLRPLQSFCRSPFCIAGCSPSNYIWH